MTLVEVWLFNNSIWFWQLQFDNVNSIQKKTFGLALSVILTLRLPQVLDKLDQILRYVLSFVFDVSFAM